MDFNIFDANEAYMNLVFLAQDIQANILNFSLLML
jgi:hypothetical protein